MNIKHFDSIVDYSTVVSTVNTFGTKKQNRKGETITSVNDVMFVLHPECTPYCVGRKPSLEYLKRELAFYISGSNTLKDALCCSKYWANCTDDGETINSNYGKLLFYDVNSQGLTQFEHAYNCLCNNTWTKKAVMTVYNAEHAYMSNDNPCTMFVAFRARNTGALPALDMRVVMRSNDIYYGLPYDLPWFGLVHGYMVHKLLCAGVAIVKGVYEHQVLDLHSYSRNEARINEALKEETLFVDTPTEQQFVDIYNKAFDALDTVVNNRKHRQFMNAAWEESKKSRCLKKHCGCILVCDGKIIAKGYGDRHSKLGCAECARDKGETFYSDGCYSVHAEMRAVISALQNGHTNWRNTIAYVTHGPCDACCKLLNYLGVREVYYDEPYKTDYAKHWPLMSVTQLQKSTTDMHKLLNLWEIPSMLR